MWGGEGQGGHPFVSCAEPFRGGGGGHTQLANKMITDVMGHLQACAISSVNILSASCMCPQTAQAGAPRCICSTGPTTTINAVVIQQLTHSSVMTSRMASVCSAATLLPTGGVQRGEGGRITEAVSALPR